jgi:serine/threonine-protein kinase
MLTAKRPFAGDSIPSVIYKIIGEEPAPPTAVNPTLHKGVDIVLAKALAKEVAERYANCAELVKDLKNFRLLKAPVVGTAAASAPSPAATPQVARTLAPPMVSGTVALEQGTVVSPPKTVAIPRPAAPPPAQRGVVSEPRKSWLAPLLIVGLLAAAAIGGGVWWQRQQAAQRVQQEEAARAAALTQQVAQQAQAVSNAAKPSPSGEPATTAPLPPPVAAPPPKVETTARKAEVKAAPPPAAPVDGRLRILTFPPNAEVRVDGADTIYRTPVNILLPAGHHKVTLKHKRTSDYTRDMVVVGNEIVELSVNLFNPDKPIPPQQQKRFP